MTEFVQLLPDKARGPAKIVDSTLKMVQVKTSDALGPLGALWTKLDSFRSSGEEECDLLELLGLAERAITLVGQVYGLRVCQTQQASVGIFGDAKRAQETLQECEAELVEGAKAGDLFRGDFLQALYRRAKMSKKNMDIRKELGRPARGAGQRLRFVNRPRDRPFQRGPAGGGGARFSQDKMSRGFPSKRGTGPSSRYVVYNSRKGV